MRSSSVVLNQVAFAQQHNNLRSDASGAAGLLVHQQLGYFALSSNPTNGKTLTLTINGSAVVFAFVSVIGSSAGNVLIGGSAAATCANLVALLNQPQATTATGVALSAPNQALLSYLAYALVGTTLTVSSNNKTAYAPLTSFSGSTNATGDSFASQTMALFVEPGTGTIAGTQVNFGGGATPSFTAPASHPRVDLVTMDNTGALAIVAGTEAASPTVPAYPIGVVTIAEVLHVVGETALFDNDNQQSGQGCVQRDSRPFFNVTQVVMAGLIMMWPASTAPSGWLVLDGSAISRATYAALFALFGTTFGPGDGSTTFNLPDARGNVVAGYKSGDANFGAFGAAVGEAAHLLTAGESGLPAHAHSLEQATSGSNSSGAVAGLASGQSDFTTKTGVTPGTRAAANSAASASSAHNNIQPSLVLSYIVKT